MHPPSAAWLLRIAVVGGLSLGGCASRQLPKDAWGYCAPPEPPPMAWLEDPVPDHAMRAERIAALLGVADEVRQAQGRGSAAETAQVVLLERVEVTRTLLEATVAELECERERSRQLAAHLEARMERWTTRFTISSIVVGAATTITSGLLLGSNTSSSSQEVVAVSGGALTGALALVSLFDHPRIEIKHERNALADVWFGPRVPSTFPLVVWAYLTRPEFSNEQAESIRAHVVARWKEVQLGGDALDVALLFGAGGRYDAVNLNLRAAMLDQVEAEVRLMNQDLATLVAGPTARGPGASNRP